MFQEFLAWWWRQLRGLLPAGLRQSEPGALPADAVLLTLETTGPQPRVALTVRRRGREGQLGTFALDAAGVAALRAAIGTARRGPVHLVLPGKLLLEQSVTLPLAAERAAGSALRFEMDRLTPFRAEDLFWTWRVERRDRSSGKLHLRLLLVPRRNVEAVLLRLDAAGLPPSSLRGDGDRRISLTDAITSPWRRRTVAAMAAACAALLLAAVAIPFVRQSVEADRLEARIASLRPLVDQADTIRRRLQATAASADVVAAETARLGDALRVLADVTDVLPDDTHLIELALRDRVLTVSGQSASAARLIPALAADPAIRNPAFAAPVTRNELSGTEEFSIRAEVAP